MMTTKTRIIEEERLLVLLVNRQRNARLLEHAPHRVMEDLAQVYALQEDRLRFTYVTEEMAAEAGYSEEQLHQIALREMPRHVTALLFPLAQTSDMPRMLSEELPFYVLTNTEQFYGASSILYPGMLAYLRMRMQTDFYILPASVHELLLVPKEEPYTPDRLTKLLAEANRDIVKPQDQLSDHLYQYESRVGKFESVPSVTSGGRNGTL